VAATHALCERGLFDVKLSTNESDEELVGTINFQTKCRGMLSGKIYCTSDSSIMYELCFPSSDPVDTPLDTEDRTHLCAGLKLSQEEDILFEGKSVDDIVIEVTPEAFSRIPTLSSGLIDFNHLNAVSTSRGIIVTCAGSKEDFYSRFFCPK
jgi:hypothetical protein